MKLKLSKDMEKAVKDFCRDTEYPLEKFISDIFILGLHVFSISTKAIPKDLIKGGDLFDKDISNLAR